jgi:Glycosyltransferase family 87
VYALATRLASDRATADVLTAINVILVVGTAAIVLQRLRGVLSTTWWWVLAFALFCFAPAMSSVWWKQVNIICLVLALGGFEMLRRGREHRGAALIALSLSVKPLAILLPFVLLAARQTRRAGAWAFAYLVALNVGAQVLLGAHAHDSSALNPWLAVKNFSQKSKPAAHLACSPENFSPQSLLCRLAGPQHWTGVQLLALAGVALLGLWVVVALRGRRPATSWDVFAYTCAISTMVSPIAWSHYQIMLAPLFVLLVVRFTTERADVGNWVGLGVAFVLASLIWSPYGTLTDALHLKFPTTFQANPHPLVTAVAEFAQYVLIVTALLWEASHRRRSAAPAER